MPGLVSLDADELVNRGKPAFVYCDLKGRIFFYVWMFSCGTRMKLKEHVRCSWQQKWPYKNLRKKVKEAQLSVLLASTAFSERQSV